MRNIFNKDRIVSTMLMVVILLMVASASIVFYSGQSIKQNLYLKREADEIKAYTNSLLYDIIHGADLSVRGYALTKNPRLAEPLEKIIGRDGNNNKDSIFGNLELQLKAQGYDLQLLHDLRQSTEEYLQLSQAMITLAKQDSTKQFLTLLNKDRGAAWVNHFFAFRDSLFGYEDQLIEEASHRYEATLIANSIIQLFLLLIGLPSLIYIVISLRSEERLRRSLLVTMEENNRKYLFHSASEVDTSSTEEVANSFIANFRKANEFISNISDGNFQVTWEGLDEANRTINQTTLAGKMDHLRNKLIAMKEEEQSRLWTTEGITKFSELVRNNQQDIASLSNQLMPFLCRYLNAQQGSLFVYEEENNDPHLKLMACYAFDRKKYIERRIEIGNGIIGQTYLEGDTVLLTEVPQNYLHITSGLGHACPTCIAIVPMKHNRKTEAILELASFKKLQPHELTFLERCGEFLASAVRTVKAGIVTQTLLQQSQKQAEELKSKEEEMRQNMEEMVSTQEELQRREKIQKEEIVHLNTLHEQNIAASKRLSLVADNTDNSVVITDAEGKIEYVNKGFTNLTGYTLQEAIGKKPGSFLQGKGTDPHAVERIRQKLKDHKAHYEEILNYDKLGREYWISLAINPIIESGAVTNYISIQTNVTKTKLLAIDFTLQLEAIGKSNAVIEFDLDGTIKTANAKFLEIMGYTLDEIKDKHHRVFVVDAESSSATYAQMWEDLKAGKSLTGEFKRRNKRGGTVWLNGTYTSIVDLNNQPYKVIKFAQDITEQKMKALDFEGQVNATDNTMASIEFNTEGKIVHANDRFLNTMGYSLEEIKNQHHRMFVDEIYAKGIEYKNFWKDLGNGLPQSGEFQRVGKNGKVVWLSASYTPIKDTEGKVYKIIKFAQDITEQKILTLDFTSQLEAIGKTNALIEFDLNGTIKHANDKFLQIMGYRSEEITGKHHRMFVRDEDINSNEYRFMWKSLGNGKSTTGVFRRKNKRGEEVWLNGTYTSIVDLNGKPYRVIKFAQDVTEQIVKSMDVEGQANAIDHAMDSVEFSNEGNIVHANSRFLNTMGYTLEEIKGKHHSIFIDEVYAKSVEYKKFWEDLGNGLPQSGEFQRIGKDEKIVWLSASYTPVKNVNGKVYKVIKLAQNITKQKLESIDFESQRQAIDKAYSVVEFDPEGKILHANDNFLQLMGYELRDIKGRHHRIFTQLDESHSADYRAFWKMLSEGEFIEGKFSRVTKAGKVIQIQGTYFGVKNLSGKIFKVVKFAQQIDNNERSRAGDKSKLTVI